MHKIESLTYVHASLEQVRLRLLNQLLYEQSASTASEQLLRQLGEVNLIQQEALMHCHSLELADLACTYGLAGTIPDQWNETMGGELYDPYQDLHDAFRIAPAPTLSCALLAYIDQLPAQGKQNYLEMVARARVDTLWPDNPLQKLTEDEVAQRGQRIELEKIEALLFATTYEEEIVQARQLAETQGDFDRIRQLLS